MRVIPTSRAKPFPFLWIMTLDMPSCFDLCIQLYKCNQSLPNTNLCSTTNLRPYLLFDWHGAVLNPLNSFEITFNSCWSFASAHFDSPRMASQNLHCRLWEGIVAQLHPEGLTSSSCRTCLWWKVVVLRNWCTFWELCGISLPRLDGCYNNT